MFFEISVYIITDLAVGDLEFRRYCVNEISVVVSSSISLCYFAAFNGHCYCFLLQAKKSKENLKEVTHKVYFDVEIDGKPAGML